MRNAAQDQAHALWPTVSEVAADPRLRMHRKVVLRCIAAGELVALDVSSPGSLRPNYRVDPASVEAFVKRRMRKAAA